MDLSLKPFINFEKELKKMNETVKQIDTKFCIHIYTKNYSVYGFFTGYYKHHGDNYILANEDINSDKIKWFKRLNHLREKIETIFFLHGFSIGDKISICNEKGQFISRYDGIGWENL